MKEKLTLSTGEEISITKPKVKTIRIVSKKQDVNDQMASLVAICTNKTEQEVDDMELIDFNMIARELRDFLEESNSI